MPDEDEWNRKNASNVSNDFPGVYVSDNYMQQYEANNFMPIENLTQICPGYYAWEDMDEMEDIVDEDTFELAKKMQGHNFDIYGCDYDDIMKYVPCVDDGSGTAPLIFVRNANVDGIIFAIGNYWYRSENIEEVNE